MDAVAAYADRADEYTEVLGSLDCTSEVDRRLVRRWCPGPGSRVMDLGCGPGHWTRFVADQGVSAVGVDPVVRFLDSARDRHPSCRFVAGDARRIPLGDASVDGVLAWYSLIHLPPAGLDTALAECARVLRGGGTMLLGFFAGPPGEGFDHQVAPAFCWSADELGRRAAVHGFRAVASHARTDPGSRRHGDLSLSLPE